MYEMEKIAPSVMADLMKQFIEKKNFNDRIALRLKMKALLDFASADTEYEPNPILQKEKADTPARDAAMGPAFGVALPRVDTPYVQAVAGIQPVAEPVPIAGAHDLMDNSGILG